MLRYQVLCRDPVLVTYILLGLLMMQRHSQRVPDALLLFTSYRQPYNVSPSVYAPPTCLSVYVIILHQAAAYWLSWLVPLSSYVAEVSYIEYMLLVSGFAMDTHKSVLSSRTVIAFQSQYMAQSAGKKENFLPPTGLVRKHCTGGSN